MAIAFTSITPSEGVTSGKTRVKIEGENFDIHPFPPTQSGYIGSSLGPSLQVFFDGVEAENVIVYPKPGGTPTETIIECNIPRFVGSPDDVPVDVDLKIVNLINPETFVESNAFMYVFPDAAGVSSLSKVVYCLMQEFNRQTPIPSAQIVQRVHVDFDDSPLDGLNIMQIAETPTLALLGPDISRSPSYHNASSNVVDVDGTPLGFRTFRQLEASDLSFDLLLIDENDLRLINLVDMLNRFCVDNGTLKIEKTFGDPTQGFLEFDMEWDNMFSLNQTPNKDNLVTASASITIRGVELERLEGVETGLAIVIDEQGCIILTEKIG